jgi:hypothetical protein
MGTVRDDVPPVCFFVTSRLSASDFFEGLRVHDSPNGTEFWKNSSQLREFPRKLSVQMFFLFKDCQTSKFVEQADAGTFIAKLTIRANWKHNLALRPATYNDREIRVLTPDELNERGLLGIQIPSSAGPHPLVVWIMGLSVTDDHIPLGDSLVVTLHDRSGAQLARFSARL